MTCAVSLSFYRRLEPSELPKRYTSAMIEALGLDRPPPPEFRRDSVELEIREIPEGLSTEAVQDFAQALHDAVRSFALEWSPGGSFIRWGYLCGLARGRGIAIPKEPERLKGRAG